MRTFNSSLAVLVVALSLAACAQRVEDVDPQGPESVKTLGQIDPQDWARAADSMVQSLLESPALANSPHTPAVMAISRIRDRSGQKVDVDLLTKKIRTSLSQSGLVATTTVIGLGGRAEDPLAKGEAQRNEFLSEGTTNETKIARPDFTLSGKIIRQKSVGRDATQVTYAFQLSLTDTARGLAVWEDERLIAKKQRNPGPRIY